MAVFVGDQNDYMDVKWAGGTRVKIYNVSKMYTKTEETAAGNQAMDSESREFQDRIAGAKNRLDRKSVV